MYRQFTDHLSKIYTNFTIIAQEDHEDPVEEPEKKPDDCKKEDTDADVDTDADKDPDAEDSEDDEEEDEDLIDPQDTLREECAQEPKAQELFQILEECTDRVNSKKNTTEDCQMEFFDYLDCINHCVVKDLFNHLK